VLTELFPSAFLATIARLSLKVKPAPPRLAVGANLSPRPGTSLEFRDYQAYSPGDDLRRVDWATYARTRHLFVRRFEHPTTIPVYVLLDSSASMHFGSPSRYSTAARITAAIASASLASHNPLRIVSTSNGAVPRSISGRSGMMQLLGELASKQNPSTVSIANTIVSSIPILSGRGSGIFCIISDLFEPTGVDNLIQALRQIPGRLVLARMVRADDAEPSLDGDYELDDCETRHRLNLHANSQALVRYKTNYQKYFSALENYASSRGARFASFDVAGDPILQLEALFPAGVLSL
jgi:uncharacterized protein (DUF58 family)